VDLFGILQLQILLELRARDCVAVVWFANVKTVTATIAHLRNATVLPAHAAKNK
tara:strand:+ start:807 stop:968 length:162 start_codon:yes stop_codon:yes gene_type:complete